MSNYHVTNPSFKGPSFKGPSDDMGPADFADFYCSFFGVGKNLEFEWGQWYYVDWLLGVWETLLGMSLLICNNLLILFMCTETHVVQT